MTRLADQLEQELAALGSTRRAEKERAYLRSHLRHLGVTVPDIRATTTRFHRDRPSLEHDEVLAVVDALWGVPVHERRMAAIELLTLRTEVLTPTDLPLLERLVREAGTWALLDGLAAKVVGVVRERHPGELEVTLEEWSTDPERWVRRACLLAHLVALREGREELDAFGRRAERLLADRDLFVRKAIAWVLRDTGRRRPGLVIDWLAPRLQHVPAPTLREAVRHLPRDDRERLLHASAALPSGRR